MNQYPSSTTQYLALYARRQPDTVAIVRNEVGVTYRQLADLVVQYTRALQDLPIAPGMLVGIECQNRLIHLLLMLACANIGTSTMSLVLRELQPDDPFLQRCDFVLTHGAAEIPAGKPGLVVTLEWMRDVEGRALQAKDWAILDLPPDPRQVARIARTSGATGQPKAIALTHAFIDDVVAQYGTHPGEKLPSPPRFILLYDLPAQFACNRVFMSIQMGGTLIFSSRATFLRDIERYGANYTMLLVGDAERLVAQMPASFAKPPVFGLATAGASLSARLRDTLLAKLASHVVDIYATNETGRICVTDAHGVGAIHSGVRIAIVDEHGREQPHGEAGLIKVKSDTMAGGYLDDPALTTSTFIDGWFHSSDFGRMPAPDRLVVMGRADDMLNVGGLKVAPGPIEDALKTIAGVRDAAVVTVADHSGVETLAIAIEANADAALESKVAEAFRQRYGRCHVTVGDSLPRTENGKIRRRDVEESFRRRLGLKA